MRAVLLHIKGHSLPSLRSALQEENIHTKIVMCTIDGEVPYDAFTGDVLMVQCASPHTPLFELIPRVRIRKYLMPILVLDEKPNDQTAKKAHECGADGYIGGPFSARAIAHELKSISAKKEAFKENRWLRAFDVRLNLEHRSVKRRNKYIKLRNKEFSLLEFLIINRGKLLSRTDIIENVWDRNAHFSSNTVDVHINRLRKKIDDPFNPKLIHTVHCMGYVFDKKVYQ